MSLSFSSFGKILEKPSQLQLMKQQISMDTYSQPQRRIKTSSKCFHFEENEGKQQSESFPFNAVSRRAKPTLCCLMPERSYEAKYTPKFEVVQCKSPSFDFGSGNQIRTRSISICSQDYYIDQYTSFRTMQKSPKAQTEKKTQSPIQKRNALSYCIPQRYNWIKIGEARLIIVLLILIKRILQQYDLLGVNYARINKRLDVGYVEFSKFTNKVMMKQDRAETPHLFVWSTTLISQNK